MCEEEEEEKEEKEEVVEDKYRKVYIKDKWHTKKKSSLGRSNEAVFRNYCNYSVIVLYLIYKLGSRKVKDNILLKNFT